MQRGDVVKHQDAEPSTTCSAHAVESGGRKPGLAHGRFSVGYDNGAAPVSSMTHGFGGIRPVGAEWGKEQSAIRCETAGGP